MHWPVLPVDTIREIDRRAVREFEMPGILLMENAGRGCADVLVRQRLHGPVVVCCGRGNNAGDGFVIARHLDLRGYPVRVLLFSDPERLTGDAAVNHRILSHSDVPIRRLTAEGEALARQLDEELHGADWIVDALLGTGARGRPRPPLDTAIARMNAASGRRLAVDTPSGLDCHTGEPASPTIRARVTCTFVAAKPGFLHPRAAEFLGEVHVLDIGAPGRLLREMQADST